MSKKENIMSINGNQFYVSTDMDPMIIDDINETFTYEENGDVSFTCNIKPHQHVKELITETDI